MSSRIKNGDSNQLPTIALVASYDTLGAAPALLVGSDSNGSGVVSLLEVARLLSALSSNPKTRGSCNLRFALTATKLDLTILPAFFVWCICKLVGILH
ncbi:Peptidase M28 [Arabidopsis thaliana x Arabidopsis arenosa]|uniref:BOS complex subunit NCLN n=1 Tax=Arabidopsis thaliana x Arabidopsis arenosa TaxID=1240361 RepID=A0A8T1ZMC8_9BRAS|nr:Peptidase M28 [Arabidopsis thaliana x Arabidopsis arenosa]